MQILSANPLPSELSLPYYYTLGCLRGSSLLTPWALSIGPALPGWAKLSPTLVVKAEAA